MVNKKGFFSQVNPKLGDFKYHGIYNTIYSKFSNSAKVIIGEITSIMTLIWYYENNKSSMPIIQLSEWLVLFREFLSDWCYKSETRKNGFLQKSENLTWN